ncbi:MAG: NmrA family NAD(P)-binding protein [Myxococcales bacterium]|nr:NmrA family NAD(P)-binding protein [Myxococcales bacterium]
MSRSKSETVLVYGATGAQGSSIVRAAVGAVANVRGVARDDREADAVRAMGAAPALANLDDPASLRRASEGASAVVLVLPLEYEFDLAVSHGRAAIDAAVDAGVERIVFDTSMRWPAERTSVPAFEIKREVARYLATRPIESTVVRPTFYLENLLGPWTLPAIVVDGVFAYPLPPTLSAAWVSHADVARVAVAAARGAISSGVIDVGGDRAVTGPEIARALSSHLRRPIAYVPIEPDAFEAALRPNVGPAAARDIALLYQWSFAHHATTLFADNTPSLDVRPATLEQWISSQRWELP